MFSWVFLLAQSTFYVCIPSSYTCMRYVPYVQVYFRAGVLEHLEEERGKFVRSKVVTVQRVLMGNAKRRPYLRLRHGAMAGQRIFRCVEGNMGGSIVANGWGKVDPMGERCGTFELSGVVDDRHQCLHASFFRCCCSAVNGLIMTLVSGLFYPELHPLCNPCPIYFHMLHRILMAGVFSLEFCLTCARRISLIFFHFFPVATGVTAADSWRRN